MPINGSRPRLALIDELKGVALILVLFYHCIGELKRPNWFHTEVGVDVFLILSGYTLAMGSPDRTTGEFFRRRLLRIFPAYWFALGAILLLDWQIRGIVHVWQSVVLHATALHAFGPEFYFWDINMSFWFLGLLVPLYVIYWATRRSLTQPATVIGAGLILGVATAWLYDAVGHHGNEEHLSVRIPSFFVGIAAALWLRGGQPKFQPNWVLGLGLLAAVYSYFVREYVFTYAIGGILVILAYSALRPRGLLRWLAVTLAAVGTYSYEIYLIHQPLIREYNAIFWTHVNGGAEPSLRQTGWGIALALAVSALVAVPLHHASRYLVHRLSRPKPV